MSDQLHPHILKIINDKLQPASAKIMKHHLHRDSSKIMITEVPKFWMLRSVFPSSSAYAWHGAELTRETLRPFIMFSESQWNFNKDSVLYNPAFTLGKLSFSTHCYVFTL